MRQGMTFWEAVWVLFLFITAMLFTGSNDKKLVNNQEILNSKFEMLCDLHPECLKWREDAEASATTQK